MDEINRFVASRLATPGLAVQKRESILAVVGPSKVGQQIAFAAMCLESTDKLFWSRGAAEDYARSKMRDNPALKYEIAEFTITGLYEPQRD